MKFNTCPTPKICNSAGTSSTCTCATSKFAFSLSYFYFFTLVKHGRHDSRNLVCECMWGSWMKKKCEYLHTCRFTVSAPKCSACAPKKSGTTVLLVKNISLETWLLILLSGCHSFMVTYLTRNSKNQIKNSPDSVCGFSSERRPWRTLLVQTPSYWARADSRDSWVSPFSCSLLWANYTQEETH